MYRVLLGYEVWGMGLAIVPFCDSGGCYINFFFSSLMLTSTIFNTGAIGNPLKRTLQINYKRKFLITNIYTLRQ